MNKFKKIEVALILSLLMLGPLSFILIRLIEFDDNHYFFNASISLSFIFIFLFIIQIIFKKSYLALVFNCHQKEERSISSIYSILQLCSRCSAIYLGILFSPLLYFLKIDYRYYLLLSIPLIIDGSLQYFTTYRSNNLKRVVTGLMFAPSLISLAALYNQFIIRIALHLFSLLN